MMEKSETKDSHLHYDYLTADAESAECALTSGGVKERLINFLRRRQTWGFLLSVAVMAIISLMFFFPDNFEGNDLRQHDMIQGIANGQEIQAYHEATGNTSRWTNSLFSGMPTFQISPTYPSDSLFSWITKVYGLGLPSPSNLLFMMMLGFMILMMCMRIRWEYGLIGAIAWGFSTYFIIIIGAGHIWKFVTLAYIPPTLGGIFLVYRGRRLAGVAVTALFMMMQIASNHVQMTYYFGFVIIGLIIAFMVKAVRTHSLRRWTGSTCIIVAGLLLGVAANLPNLYHTWRYSKETQRGTSELAQDTDNTNGLSRDYITEYSYGVAETFTLLIPNVKGGATVKPVDGHMEFLPLSDVSKASDFTDQNSQYYLRQVPQYFGEPEMTNGPVYVGAIIFALFLLGCIVVRGPLKWTLVALTVLSVALAWGRNFMSLTDLFIDIVPMYSKFRTPESILVIAEFTIPLLAVMGLCNVLRTGSGNKKSLRPVFISFGTAAFFCLAGVIFPGLYGLEDEVSQNVLSLNIPNLYNSIIETRASMVQSDSLRSLLFVALGCGTMLLYLYKGYNRFAAASIVALLVLTDLYTVNKRYLSTDSFHHTSIIESAQEEAKITPTEIDLLIMQDTDPNYRVADFDRFGSAQPSYFHKMIGGYHAAKLGRYNDLITRHIGRPSTEQDLALLDMLNARYFIQNGEVFENPDALGNAWFVDKVAYVDNASDEMDALDYINPATEAVADRRFADILGTVKESPGSTARIVETSYAPDRLTYRSESNTDGVAVFSEIYFPWGWEATIDGKPAEIGRVNYVLRAMRIPAGSHEIVMAFTVPSIKTTSAAATAAVIVIYLLVIAAILRASGFCPCRLMKKSKK